MRRTVGVGVYIAATLALIACASNSPEDHKRDLENLGFSEVEVSVEGDTVKATVTIGKCKQVPFQRSPQTGWEAEQFATKQPQMILTEGFMLAQKPFEHCVPDNVRAMSAEDLTHELERRGFTDVEIADTPDRSASVSVGKCHDIPLPWVGVKGYPTEWYGRGGERHFIPKDGLTAKYLLSLPTFEDCR
jgi:hypothetical protein